VLTYAYSNIEATFALFTQSALGFGPTDNGWLFVVMGFVAAATQAFGTRWLANHVDEPRRVALGLVLLAGGAALLPSASSLVELLGPVTLMAIGFATSTPSLTAWVSRRSPPDRQGELIGLGQSAGALARVAGPGVGGLLFDHVSHGAPFRIAAVVLGGAAALALWARRP